MSGGHFSSVVNNTALYRYELKADGEMACLEYSIQGTCMSLDHTYVPNAMRGKGAGAALVRVALEEARQKGWSITPKCTFVAAFLRKHST